MIVNRNDEPRMRLFDAEWNTLDFSTGAYPLAEKDIEKPECLSELISVAEKLAEGFAHVRVDLYILNDQEIKFGEMTFTSASGTAHWNPPEADEYVGKFFKLPNGGLPLTDK